MQRFRSHVVIGPLTAAVLVLAGCTTSTQTVLEPLPPVDEGASAVRLDGTVVNGRNRQTTPEVSAGTPNRIGMPGGAAGGEGSFSLDFADADIRAVIDQILGTMLKVDYTVDPEVKGTATFRTASPLPRALLLPTLETLLNQNGAALVQAGPLYRILPAKSAAAAGGTMVLPLRYASAQDLAKVLQPIIGQNAPEGGLRLSADTGHNALVISGDASSRAAIVGLVRAFDTDLMAGQSYALFPVTSDADPRKIANELDKIFQTGAGGAQAGVVRVVPMEEAQAVLVIASAPSLIDDARRIFALMDRTRAINARDWHVYFAQNGDSTELAVILQRAFTPGDVSAASQLSSANKSATSQSQFNSSSGSGSSGLASGASGGGTTGGTTGTVTASSTPPPAAGSSGASAATESLSAGAGDSGTTATASFDTLRIVADRANNSILIYATPDEEQSIDSMLSKIDILPLQVRIDATVAEVDLNDVLQYGTQFFLKKGGVNGLLTTGTSAVPSSGLAGLAPGFTGTLGSIGSAEGVLSALADVTNVRVLSSPEIMVLDNQAAHLLVGNLIPYLTQSAQSTVTSSAAIINSVSYRETGIILDVTPRVGKGGLVTLDLSQEVSDLGPAELIGGQSTPTFSERQVRSRVVVQDGNTVGLAGLISDNVSRENAGIPLLKDIPYIGSLFSTQTNNRKRTELLVLITPHVERNQREIRTLTEDLRHRLPAAAVLPQDLNQVPLSGKANPNATVTP